MGAEEALLVAKEERVNQVAYGPASVSGSLQERLNSVVSQAPPRRNCLENRTAARTLTTVAPMQRYAIPW